MEEEIFVPHSFFEDPFNSCGVVASCRLDLRELLCDELLEWDGVSKTEASTTKVLRESRFGNQVTSEEELAKASKGFVPKSTSDNTQWDVCSLVPRLSPLAYAYGSKVIRVH